LNSNDLGITNFQRTSTATYESTTLGFKLSTTVSLPSGSILQITLPRSEVEIISITNFIASSGSPTLSNSDNLITITFN